MMEHLEMDVQHLVDTFKVDKRLAHELSIARALLCVLAHRAGGKIEVHESEAVEVLQKIEQWHTHMNTQNGVYTITLEMRKQE